MAALTRRYDSFGGPDITALFNNIPFASLQHIEYSIVRDKTRIFTLGSADARSFSRGKRVMGGALVFILLNRNELLAAMKEGKTQGQGGFYTSADEVRTDSDPRNLQQFRQTVVDPARFNATTGGPLPVTDTTALGVADPTSGAVGGNNYFSISGQDPWYVDQIPPFQVSLVGANETGAIVTMKLFNVELTGEASGVGIDDVVIEQQYQFMCTGIQNWTLVQESQSGFGLVN